MGKFYCQAYGVTLSPWRCIENQLSLYCLPGWPCETCESAIVLRIASRDASAAREAQSARSKKHKLPAWLKNASRAVIRDYWREHPA